MSLRQNVWMSWLNNDKRGRKTNCQDSRLNERLFAGTSYRQQWGVDCQSKIFSLNFMFYLKQYVVYNNLNIISLWSWFLGLKQQITKCFETRCSPKRPEYASNVVFSQPFSGRYKPYKITNESARRTACFQLLYAQLTLPF